MNREQNIDDILKLLKDSVSAEQPQSSSVEEVSESDNLSAEALQEKLKNQYISEGTADIDDNTSANEYAIDNEFLSEALTDIEPETDAHAPSENIEVEQPDITEDNAFDVLNETHEDAYETKNEIVIEQLSLFGEPERTVIKLDDGQEQSEQNVLVLKQAEPEVLEDLEQADADNVEQFDIFEEIPEEIELQIEADEDNAELTVEDSENEAAIFEIDEDDVSCEEAEGEIAAEDMIIDQVVMDEVENEMITDTEAEEDEPEFEVVEEVPQKTELHETFLASMRKTGMDFTTDDIYNSSLRAAEATDTYMEDVKDSEILQDDELLTDDIDTSTINLMMQFGEVEQLEKKIGEENMDRFFKKQDENLAEKENDHVSEGKEYMSAEQNEKILDNYRQKLILKLFSVIACASLALIAFALDILPIVGAKLSWIFDYNDYPAAFVFFGLQLVLVACVIRRRALWKGLKHAFSLSPTKESPIAVALMLVVIYDILCFVLLCVTLDRIPNMYNGMAILTVAIGALCDYLQTLSDKYAFEVYSADANKFTLFKETESSAIGRKMYSGGLETDKSIYSIRNVDFPSGYFKSKSGKSNISKLFVFAVIPVLLIGTVSAVSTLLLSNSPYTVLASFIVSAFLLAPTVYATTESVINFVAVKKLYMRGIAFSSEYAAEKYSNADVMIFGDYHMFKKCKTEDVGIAMYDTKVGYLALGCIDALYKKIGGPLSGLQMELPDVFKFENVVIRRITRNGIEAVIEGKHVIIVGEHAFMQRYGLSFPTDEGDSKRSTLCVSLNGKVTAKLSVKYEVEPIFEMLAERLYSDRIICAVQTLDPLINSALIASSRTMGSCPISVVHGNASDFASSNTSRYNKDFDGVICCSSRLKLCEAVVWLKRLARSRKILTAVCTGLCAIGAAAIGLLTAFNGIEYVNSLYLIAYLAISVSVACAVTLVCLPPKNYFTVDALYADLERIHVKEQSEKRKKRSENIRKMTKQDKNNK